MRSCWLSLGVFVLLTVCLSAQTTAFPVSNMASQGLLIESLYQQYPKAITEQNEDVPVFAGSEDVCYTAYVKFITEFALYLKDQRFRWGRATKCYNQIFFSEDGQVDYFIYEFPKGSISLEKQSEYQRLLNQFLHSFCFKVTGNQSFSLNGYITFKDL